MWLAVFDFAALTYFWLYKIILAKNVQKSKATLAKSNNFLTLTVGYGLLR